MNHLGYEAIQEGDVLRKGDGWFSVGDGAFYQTTHVGEVYPNSGTGPISSYQYYRPIANREETKMKWKSVIDNPPPEGITVALSNEPGRVASNADTAFMGFRDCSGVLRPKSGGTPFIPQPLY